MLRIILPQRRLPALVITLGVIRKIVAPVAEVIKAKSATTALRLDRQRLQTKALLVRVYAQADNRIAGYRLAAGRYQNSCGAADDSCATTGCNRAGAA